MLNEYYDNRFEMTVLGACHSISCKHCQSGRVHTIFTTGYSDSYSANISHLVKQTKDSNIICRIATTEYKMAKFDPIKSKIRLHPDEVIFTLCLLKNACTVNLSLKTTCIQRSPLYKDYLVVSQ